MTAGSPAGAKPASPAPGQTPAPAAPPAVPLIAPPAPPAPGDGMMAGVVPGAPGMKDEKKKPVTAFGRYLKILLSSNEFLFLS
jgi:hypothetical protein